VHCLFSLLRFGHGVDLVDLPLPLLKLLLCNVIHPAQQRVVNGFLREEQAGGEEKY